MSAEELRAGDVVKSFAGVNGIVETVEVEALAVPVKVYNFEVEDWHTYFVGECFTLVHNDCANKTNVGRKGALREAKRDAGIPMAEQPYDVRRNPMREAEFEGGHVVKDSNGHVIMTREYYYKNQDGNTIVIQDHSAGHIKGEQGSHFNVRPDYNTRNGHVPGTQDHYPYRK